MSRSLGGGLALRLHTTEQHPFGHLSGRTALGLFESPQHFPAPLCPRKMQEAAFHAAFSIAAKPSASPVTWVVPLSRSSHAAPC